MNMAHVFFYGTLRQYCSRSRFDMVSRYLEFVDFAEMPGELYEVQGYPGAIHLEGDGPLVKGELYRVQNEQCLFEILDEYEECSDVYPQPHEYRRIICAVHLSTGVTRPAWVYLYNRSVEGMERIASGDYAEFLSQHPGNL